MFYFPVDGLYGLSFYRAFGSKHFIATGFNPLLHEFNIKSPPIGGS